MSVRFRNVAKFTGRPVWAEISISALEHNLRAIAGHVNPLHQGRKPGRVRVLAVVKGNGYGHGAADVAPIFAKAGADWFGVTCSAEGIELRDAGIREPILVMTGFWPGEEARIVAYKLTPAVTRCEQLHLLDRAAARAKLRGGARFDFHLKIDSGMNRLGISPADVPCFVRALAKCPHLHLSGTMTHFASSDDFRKSQNEDQEKRFLGAVESLRKLGVNPGIVHMANSAAIVSRPETWADMVRPGAILYGYHQFYDPPEKSAEAKAALPLRPALSLKTRVVSLRSVAPGEAVGYGARFVANRPSRIAVLAAGYADGLRRELTNRGRVILRGKFAPLVGTISMDLAMADVTDIAEVELGDVATLYGAEGEVSQYVSDVARLMGTVSSDLLCSIGKRVPRFFLK